MADYGPLPGRTGRADAAIPADPGQCAHGRPGDVNAAPVRAAVAEAGRRIAERGRILVRASGTEPVMRVMVEGETLPKSRAVAEGSGTAAR